MANKRRYSVAAIMVKHPISKNLSVYSCSHAVTGYYDEETETFTDLHKNVYKSITNEELITSSEPYAYNYVLATDILPATIGKGVSLEEAITKYEAECKKDVILVGLNDGIPFSSIINIPQLIEEFKSQEEPKEKISKQKKHSQTTDDFSDEANVEKLILNIIEKKYSIEELKRLEEKLNDKYSRIDSLRETVRIELLSNDQQAEECNPLLASMIDSLGTVKKTDYVYDPLSDIRIHKPEKIDIESVFKKVTKTLVSQDDAARRVIVEIARKEMDNRRKQSGILLTGDTGVGKTLLMELIAKYIGRPFHKIDSTQLTIPGYVGKNIEEELWDLYVKCGKNKQKAENAIIFFDEIDKKGSSSKSDVSGQGVLNLLLPFIEGTTYDASASSKTSDTKVKINTSNMIVILGGAFTDVYKNLIEKNGVGFSADVSTEQKQREAKIDDFVEYAMMPEEFMGRVTIVRLNPLTVDSIKKILRESDASAVNIQQEIFRKLGVRLKITDGFIDRIAQQAEKRRTGARGLNSLVDDATWQAFSEAYKNPDEIEEVIIDESALDDPSNFQLVKRRKSGIN